MDAGELHAIALDVVRRHVPDVLSTEVTVAPGSYGGLAVLVVGLSRTGAGTPLADISRELAQRHPDILLQIGGGEADSLASLPVAVPPQWHAIFRKAVSVYPALGSDLAAVPDGDRRRLVDVLAHQQPAPRSLLDETGIPVLLAGRDPLSGLSFGGRFGVTSEDANDFLRRYRGIIDRFRSAIYPEHEA